MHKSVVVLGREFQVERHWPTRQPATKRWTVFMRTSFGDFEYGRYATERQAREMALRNRARPTARMYVAAPDGAKYTPLP